MHDELSVVEFDGDEAVAEAMAGLDERPSTRGALCSAGRRGSGWAGRGDGVAAAVGVSPARVRAARRPTTSRSSTTR